MSALSSVHFASRRVSDSWLFFSALWIFSYSTRKRSSDLSPLTSFRNCDATRRGREGGRDDEGNVRGGGETRRRRRRHRRRRRGGNSFAAKSG
eukprot:24566-Pelagococcus_subviridis.AAC.12